MGWKPLLRGPGDRPDYGEFVDDIVPPRVTPRPTRPPHRTVRRAAGVLALAWSLVVAHPVLAVTAERAAALAEGEGDVGRFLYWLLRVAGGFAAAAVVAGLVTARRARREARAAAGWSAGTCLSASAALVLGALAVAGFVAAALASRIGLQPTSAEGGPMEVAQLAMWVGTAVVAVVATWYVRDRDARGALLLLGAGAVLAALREADLHEKLNPKSFGAWGVRFRGDWWFSAASPVGPRVLWAAVAVAVVVAAVYVVRRGGPALLTRGRPHNRLLPPLAAVAGLMFLGFGLDDLLRYRPGVNLRQSQVCEEALELAAVLVYLGCVVWAARLGRTPLRAADHQ